MKGVIFTELLNMLEEQQSAAFVQELIDDTELKSNGVYTKVGTYPTCEIVALVTKLSEKTGLTIPELLGIFGKHLFGQFANMYPQYFRGVDSAFDFLKSVEDVIHVDVKKLYPDAELPKFDIQSHDQDHIHFVYTSKHNFGDLCQGLISGCLEHFEEEATINRNDLDSANGAKIEFTVTKQAA